MRKTIGLAAGCLALCGAALGAWRLVNCPTWQVAGVLVPRVAATRPVVALTFDDGPTEEGVEAILPMLSDAGVRGTFFVTGAALEQRLDLGRRIVDCGHELGNHSYSHSRMVFVRESTVKSEVEQTDALIREAGHRGPIYFRPPYGKKGITLPFYLRESCRVTVTWDLAPDADPTLDAKDIATAVIERARPGSIVLLHVMERTVSREAVPKIVEGLRRRGFEFVTVSELLALEGRSEILR